MATREIPASLFYVCDGCGVEMPGSDRSRPKYWSQLVLRQDAYDYQGCAVADGTVTRDLCRPCTDKVTSVINAAIGGK
jgi:hypothetical protein